MSTADDIKRLATVYAARAIHAAEDHSLIGLSLAAGDALHTTIDALQSELDSLLEALQEEMANRIQAQHERDALLEALRNLLDGAERHIFATECQKERDAARAAIKASEGKAA
jgi:hypothetical protein